MSDADTVIGYITAHACDVPVACHQHALPDGWEGIGVPGLPGRARPLGYRHRAGEVPWVVMADPEGSESCVLTPR